MQFFKILGMTFQICIILLQFCMCYAFLCIFKNLLVEGNVKVYIYARISQSYARINQSVQVPLPLLHLAAPTEAVYPLYSPFPINTQTSEAFMKIFEHLF